MHREIQKPLSVTNHVVTPVASWLTAYVSLTKPRIIGLLLVITLATMVIAAGGIPPLPLVLLTLLGGALMSGSANVLNCYLDRDIDRVMARTRNRPLVTGMLTPLQALVFGVILTVLAWIVFALGVNGLSGLIAFGGLLVYVLIYTPSKRMSPISVLIGAIAGAVPPLVAWVAVTGSLSLPALLLFAIMAVWQIPHTLALTLMLYNDYARADVPVSPVRRGALATRREIVFYSVLLAGLTLLPTALGVFGAAYVLGALLLGGRFIMLALAGLSDPGARNEVRLYKFSLLYLALLFLLMSADRIRF